jgi:23S rRNA (cytosine1962-C5)-methyltransferase
MERENTIKLEVSESVDEYRLLDSGNKLKLEQIGGVVMVRSEPRAWWKPSLAKEEWDKAVALFESENKKGWIFKKDVSQEFEIKIQDFNILIKFLKTSKHVGVFPEQSAQWKWIKDIIVGSKREVNVLNLFGYTGLSTLAAAAAGAKVTHVDGSKTVMSWARANQELSGLSDKPIRWILDDVISFIKREIKRGVKYDAIIMDPPSFGRGPKGELWKIEENLPELLDLCKSVLSPSPLFVILNIYATELSALSVGNLVSEAMKGFGGRVENGELALREKKSQKIVPMSVFARWQN